MKVKQTFPLISHSPPEFVPFSAFLHSKSPQSSCYSCCLHILASFSSHHPPFEHSVEMAFIKDHRPPLICQIQWSILCPHLYLPAAFVIVGYTCLSEILSSLGIQKLIAPLFLPHPRSFILNFLFPVPPLLFYLQMLTCLRGSV